MVQLAGGVAFGQLPPLEGAPMSLFPRHLRPGQTLTIHLRLSPSPPCFPRASTVIRDPLGRIVFEAAHQEHAWVPAVDEPQPSSTPLGGGLYETQPLLFVAEGLRPDVTRRAELVRVLQDIGHARHSYGHWTVPADAPLGRYEVAASSWVNGHEHRSPTAKDDHVFVERLSIESWERASGGARATILNPSPEPTFVRVHELSREGTEKGAPRVSAVVRRELLPAGCATELRLGSERALLYYAEDAACLWLNAEQQPTWIRSQTCAWLRRPDDLVLVTSQTSRRSFSLRGAARAIWLAADGLASRAELEALGPEAFKSLVDAGLLHEL
jgi:hypothetical protein